jgi:tetratricopeptide (TPR) repeat protein
MTGSNDNPRTSKRLDTWKEIGGFFGRDERTVKRWEMTRKLPVHRVPGGGRANVYAYEAELAEWLRSSDAQVDERDETPVENADKSGTSDGGITETSVTAKENDQSVGADDSDRSSEKRSWGKSALILAAVAVFVVGGGLLIYRSRDSVLSGGGTAGKPGAHQVTPESEELYLKGIYYWHNRTPESLNQAVDYFTQAIVRDPNNAEAYVGLANCYNLLREYSTMPDSEAYPRAIAAAKRAIALDESLSGAHSSLGFAEYYWMWDVAGAQKEFQRALELDPKSVNAHHWYATMLMSLGREKESLAEIEKAQELDPQSKAILADKSLIMVNGEMREAGILQLKQLESSEPNFLSPHNYLAGIYFDDHDYRNFLAESRIAATLQHDDSRLKIVSAGEKGLATSGALGLKTEILKVQKGLYADGKIPAYDLAISYGWLGDKTEALKYLQIAYTNHDAALLAVRIEPAFAGFHKEKAFQKLLVQIGLPPLQ